MAVFHFHRPYRTYAMAEAQCPQYLTPLPTYRSNLAELYRIDYVVIHYGYNPDRGKTNCQQNICSSLLGLP